MKETSTRSGGSPFERRIRERKEEEARIVRETVTGVLREALGPWTRLAEDSARRWRDALDSTAGAMERRLRRRWTERLALVLSGAALCLTVQGSALWTAGDRLIWPQLEIQALNRAGLGVRTGPDGSRWILFPEGSVTSVRGLQERTETAMFILMPGS